AQALERHAAIGEVAGGFEAQRRDAVGLDGGRGDAGAGDGEAGARIVGGAGDAGGAVEGAGEPEIGGDRVGDGEWQAVDGDGDVEGGAGGGGGGDADGTDVEAHGVESDLLVGHC